MKLSFFLIVSIILVGKCACFSDLICTVLESNSTEHISQECLKQLNTVCRNSNLAWMMFDASSRYPFSGMSYNFKYDYGNYDECLSIKHEDADGTIVGKHCPLQVIVIDIFGNNFTQASEQDLNTYFNEHNPIDHHGKLLALNEQTRASTTLTDINYSLISMCVPEACTPKEVGSFSVIGNNSLTIYLDRHCDTLESTNKLETRDIIVISVFAFIILLMIISTWYDFILYRLSKKTKHPLFVAFSLLSNTKKLVHISTNTTEQIQCFNGMRFISMLWVIGGHGFTAYNTLPSINTPEILEYERRWYTQLIQSAPIAVDTFFFMSGFLLAYGYLKAVAQLSITQKILGVPTLYIHRYLRLTPAVAMMYVVSISIIRLMGSGPLWYTLTNSLRTSCETNWWPFFLYIQNYYNYNDFCVTQTWYLSADMQMFLLSPLILIPASIFAKKHLKGVIISLLGLTVICIIFPMVIRFLDHSIDNVYDTHSRINDYLIGIILGIIMRLTKDRPFPFSKTQNRLLWFAVFVACIIFNSLYFLNYINYEHTTDTLFYGLYRPLWCSCLAWMVYSCYYGHGGIANWVLSRPIFQICGRLAYCMYVLHGIVIMVHGGRFRTLAYFNSYEVFYEFCGNLIMTMILSIFWTLAFESPMIIIEKFIFEGRRKRS